MVLVHAIRVEQVKEILGHLIRGGRKISALFAESTEGTADLVQDALPLLLGTLPADDDVNIPYRPGFASRYDFRLDMLSERSSFLSGQIRNEKRTAGMPYTVARTRTVREASDRQRAKRLPCRRPLAPRCYTPGCLKSIRWRETNRRGGAHFLPLPRDVPETIRPGPPVKKKGGFFFFPRDDFLRVSPEPAERRAVPVSAPGSRLCGCVRAGEPRPRAERLSEEETLSTLMHVSLCPRP